MSSGIFDDYAYNVTAKENLKNLTMDPEEHVISEDEIDEKKLPLKQKMKISASPTRPSKEEKKLKKVHKEDFSYQRYQSPFTRKKEIKIISSSDSDDEKSLQEQLNELKRNMGGDISFIKSQVKNVIEDVDTLSTDMDNCCKQTKNAANKKKNRNKKE